MLDQLYQCIITPIFFIETLADLSKNQRNGRTAEQLVGGLAERTPVVHSAINAGHWSLILNSLAGDGPPLDGRPTVPGGIPVRVEGEEGVVFHKAPEAEAFERWQRGRFDEVEHLFARVWRESITSLNLSIVADTFRKQMRKEERPKSFEEAKTQARRFMLSGGANYRSLQLAYRLLNTPPEFVPRLTKIWKARGSRPLREHAPYAAHCLEIDLFFYLAMSNGIISDQRATNLIDIAYLYYLPFTDIFVSSDRLHRRTAPLFMRDNQVFVWGPDLKADLRAADEHFWSLPEQERARGLFLLATSPPRDSQGIIANHWDTYRMGWRQKTAIAPPAKGSALHAKLMAGSEAMRAAAKVGQRMRAPRGEPARLMIERHIPRRRGKWQMFSPEFEAKNSPE